MSVERHHADWLSVIEFSGPFLSIGVLSKVFPNEMESHDPAVRSRLKAAVEEWEEEGDDRAVHNAFVRFVLEETLELEGLLLEGQQLPPGCEAPMPIHGETLRPDLVVGRPTGNAKPQLFISIVGSDQKLEGPLKGKRWSASPATRMMELLHRTDQPLGLITNGTEWMLVWAKPGQTTGFASWRMDVLIDEVVLLRAFRTLLGRNRFFGVPDDETLAALYEQSSQDQKEVTDQLGRQVRNAVSMLISTFDWYDRDDNRELLGEVDEKDIYEASLTVMMRLVFLLCAEERGLLLLGKNALYDQYYAISPLRDQLREVADRDGEEALHYRRDAWSRLLALFRAVHAGLAHEDLRLPAYGGSLFDPDRFPFLEGRKAGTSWKEEPAYPLPVDNQTVLGMLEALQLLEIRGKGRKGQMESQRLSYRALDIEQIGHVYEGLLDHTAARATEAVVGLVGRDGSGPDLALSQLEEWTEQGHEHLVESLKKETGRTVKAIEKGLLLYETIDRERLTRACDGDEQLSERVHAFAGLVRETPGGRLAVLPEQGIYVTHGSDRRSTGTHYTPRGLTEEIVQHALDPLVYAGMADGVEPTPETLKSPEEILALKICDMAMGSGAFLVQTCRYLSEKLVEAWERRESANEGPVALPFALLAKEGEHDLMPPDGEERMATARRLVAERCLYGVDKNPLAVEMAKLSLWLITLDANKPFSFVDHALRCGDSLIGVTSREQLRCFNLQPKLQAPSVFGDQLLEALETAEQLRRDLESFTVREPRDGERKAALLREAENGTAVLKAVADLLIAVYLNASGKPKEDDLAAVTALIQHGLERDWLTLKQVAQERLDRDKPMGTASRRPFHWALEFPEVLARGGFDAIVGNPPFQGGKKITGPLGEDYREYLVWTIARGIRGNADLCAYFLLRAAKLALQGAMMGLLATSTIAEGDTREVGLEQLLVRGIVIPRAVPKKKWPGEAALLIACLWFYKGSWKSQFRIGHEFVSSVTALLVAPGTVEGKPTRLQVNAGKSFQGTNILGAGFIYSIEEAMSLLALSSSYTEVLAPYLSGKDLNAKVERTPSRWVINFSDWSLEQAQEYPECFAKVLQEVKPLRDKNKKAFYRNRWWQFGERCPGLYRALAQKHVHPAAISSVSKYLWFTKVSPGWVFDHNLTIVVTSEPRFFAILNSSFHLEWAYMYSSTLGHTPGYRPRDAFETFPFPEPLKILEARLLSVFTELEIEIESYMLTESFGLTAAMNRVNDMGENAVTVKRIRNLMTNLDLVAQETYGWTDLDLGHGFHQTKQGLRYTISESARLEVLDRLLALNHERYAEEVAQGLHVKGKNKKKAPKPKKKPAEEKAQGLLF